MGIQGVHCRNVLLIGLANYPSLSAQILGYAHLSHLSALNNIMSRPVELKVYDLSGGLAKSLSLALIGKEVCLDFDGAN